MGNSISDSVDKDNSDGNDLPVNSDHLSESSLDCEQLCYSTETEVNFVEIEAAAILRLGGMPSLNHETTAGVDVAGLLNTLDYPAFVATANGFVVDSNISAWKRFNVGTRFPVAQLPVKPEGNNCLGQLIATTIQNAAIDAERALIITRAMTTDLKHPVMVVISATTRGKANALLLIVEVEWKTKSLFQNQFNLTRTEIDVLESVVQGYSSKEIALKRRRSNETIRAQIQSIREKAGAKTQADLVRAVITLCTFERDMKTLVQTASHPRRRQAQILCKGGRRVELTLMGDFSGDPVLSIANTVNYTFATELENALYDRGLYLISVCTPGCGKTDLPPDGVGRLDCLIQDVRSVLMQLEIDRIMIMAYNASAPLCYFLANHISKSIYHFAQVAAPVPIAYLKKSCSLSPWLNRVLGASHDSKGRTRDLVKQAIRMMATHGGEQYLKRNLAASPAEAEVVFKPENLRELNHAIHSATRNGVGTATDDIAMVFDDWTADILNLSVGITVIHGEEDSLYPVQSVCGLFRENTVNASLRLVPDAGFPLLQSSPVIVAGYLREIVDNYSE